MDSRAAILTAARRVFARRGLDGASVREVAEAARVNNAMIYYYFRDKTELYRAVLSDSFSEMDRIWEDEIFLGPAPVRRKIRKYVEGFIRFHHVNDDLQKILSMEFACCSDNLKWLADRFFSNNYKRLSSILKHGMKSGELRKFNPTNAVASLIGMLIHPFILRPIAEHVTDAHLDLSVSRFGAFITELFFEGLALKKP